MTATISIKQDDITTALRGFLLSIVSAEVVLSQENGVPMPIGNFITMTPLNSYGRSTSRITYSPNTDGSGTQDNLRTTEWGCQLDCYGPNAADIAATIAPLVRTEFSCEYFANSGVDMKPLYATEPHQNALTNAEAQYENRWTFDFHAQINPVVSVPQDFFTNITIKAKSIDATFPPEN